MSLTLCAPGTICTCTSKNYALVYQYANHTLMQIKLTQQAEMYMRSQCPIRQYNMTSDTLHMNDMSC